LIGIANLPPGAEEEGRIAPASFRVRADPSRRSLIALFVGAGEEPRVFEVTADRIVFVGNAGPPRRRRR
jgi:hypothetical protein